MNSSLKPFPHKLIYVHISNCFFLPFSFGWNITVKFGKIIHIPFKILNYSEYVVRMLKTNQIRPPVKAEVMIGQNNKILLWHRENQQNVWYPYEPNQVSYILKEP